MYFHYLPIQISIVLCAFISLCWVPGCCNWLLSISWFAPGSWSWTHHRHHVVLLLFFIPPKWKTIRLYPTQKYYLQVREVDQLVLPSPPPPQLPLPPPVMEGRPPIHAITSLPAPPNASTTQTSTALPKPPVFAKVNYQPTFIGLNLFPSLAGL